MKEHSKTSEREPNDKEVGNLSDAEFKTLVIMMLTEMIEYRSSRQDGGIGRNPSLPRTTKRRITANLKSINNHKCQKIKMHGTLTIMELNKQSTRTTRQVRQWTERNQGKAADHGGGAG